MKTLKVLSPCLASFLLLSCRLLNPRCGRSQVSAGIYDDSISLEELKAINN